MRRGYTRDDYLRKVETIRERISGATMSTDVIVGFCGESDRQFRRTCDLIQEVRFDKVHAAAYSTREGTIAARKMEDDVPAEEKKRRLAELEVLQEGIATELNAAFLGRTERVLVEQVRGGRATGRNRNDKLVHFDAVSPDDLVGHTIDVHIDKTGPWALVGTAQMAEAGARGTAIA
jgi:tRNA-2-methylthio-N6-dimethylallyladenosine synthase